MRLRNALGIIIGLALVHGATDAQAAPFRLRLENVTPGMGFVVTDQNLGDLNPLTGAIAVSQDLGGGFVASVTVGTSQPFVPNELLLSSITVAVTGPGTLRVSLEDAGFSFGPVGPMQVQVVGFGTLGVPAGSTATLKGWVDPTNAVPVYGPDTGPVLTALGGLGAIPPTAVLGGQFTFGPGVAADVNAAGFINGGLYSLFSEAEVVFSGPGSVSLNLNVRAVPEPGSMWLLGTGFLGLAAVVRRRLRHVH